VASGTPDQVAKSAKSITAKFLEKALLPGETPPSATRTVASG
jgi:hypothetical protein